MSLCNKSSLFGGKHGVLDLQHSQAKEMSLGFRAVVIIEESFIIGVNSDSKSVFMSSEVYSMVSYGSMSFKS